MSFLIHRIRLENVRGIGEVEVELHTAGVTVIQAPNETGKSTLFDAVNILRKYKSSSNAGDVRSLQPVGKDVGSLIEVDLTVGPYFLTFTKRFNRDRMTELRIHSPQPEQLTGDDAHNRLEQIFESHVDLVLLESLWIKQGQGLDEITLDKSSAVSEALSADRDNTPNQVPNGSFDPSVPLPGEESADESLLERVEQEFLKYFTQTGKDGQALKKVQQIVEDAAQQLEQIKKSIAEIASLSNQHVKVNTDLERAVESQLEVERQFNNLKQQMAEIRAHRATQEKLNSDLELAAFHVKNLEKQYQQRKDWDAKLHTLRSELATVTSKTETHEQRVAELDAEIAQLKEDRSSISEQVTRTVAAREQAERKVQLITTRRDHALLTARLADIEKADQQKSNAQIIVEANNISLQHVDAIRAAQDEVRLAQARLTMAAPTVTVAALQEVDVALDGVSQVLHEGTFEERNVEKLLKLRVEDAVDIEIRPGSSLDELTAALDSATQRYESSLQAAKVSSLQEAERALELRREATSTIESANRAIESVLRGETRELLHEQLHKLDAVLLALTQPEMSEALSSGADEGTATTDGTTAFNIPDRSGSAEEADALDSDSLESEEQTAQGAHADASSYEIANLVDAPESVETESEVQERLEAAKSEESRARIALAKVQANLDSAQDNNKSERELLAQSRSIQKGIESQIDQLKDEQHRAQVEISDEDVAHQLHEKTTEHDRINTDIEGIADKLTAMNADSVELLYSNAEERLNDSSTLLTSLREKQIEITAALEARGGSGLAEELAQAEAEYERAQQRARQTNRRAQAVRLLKQHLEDARAEVFETYRAPLRNRINTLGKVVFDHTFEVEIDDSFAVTRRTLGGNTLDRSALSSGAQEQLSVLTAVAAAQLASEGGVPLILDDTLGFSDPDRMERVGAVLSRVNDAQVIVLTCVPARFDTIGGAYRVDLDPVPS